jgi:hypothetical protein
MKKMNWFVIALIALCLPLSALNAAEETPAAPSAYFPETAHTFQPVVAGANVSHTYMVQNKGTAILEIQKVHTA